ncbi:MAG: DoxX family protein [Candidatus Giovannonibacteria bacterium GW2011_GWC2_44_9]|uniref:DoxX family protein n=1 Tax=Candidatus Giovannonibacteria bacterium GW2011_GWC2_44_9 TaxID=1618658 RepID=A0A0G1KII2_9BACT|nr:MAG: DoxX family protein [Candidatus Giovannonibacteria bacterium GW2011_GWC2_44_9]
MLSILPQLLDFQFYVPLLLRLALGAIFLAHGWQKLRSDKIQLAGWLESMKFKPGEFWAWVVTLVECLGGIALVVGLFMQLTALILAIQFIVIILYIKRGQKFIGGWEFDFLIFTALIALLVLGPGAWAFDLPL